MPGCLEKVLQMYGPKQGTQKAFERRRRLFTLATVSTKNRKPKIHKTAMLGQAVPS